MGEGSHAGRSPATAPGDRVLEAGKAVVPDADIEGHPTGGDDESEWEYEYSSTETETYYLTVELSYPEFKGEASKNPHHSRGGYYKTWLGQKEDRPETAPMLGRNRGATSQRDGGANDGNNEEPAPAAEDDDMQYIHPSLRTTERPVAADDGPENEFEHDGRPGDEELEELEDLGPTDDIQILDLHSRQPIISYRGHVFEGEWAEMIGTELILARHHEAAPQNQLPALRNLPGDVDLLAASASRILTTKKALQPKAPQEDSLAPIRKEWNIHIPSGKGRSSERAQQAGFLEKLIALKIKKGDTDKVTVYAKDGLGKTFRDDRGPDFRPRRKRTTGKTGEDDEGENGDVQSRSKRRRPGRPIARSRTKGSHPRQGVLHGGGGPAELLSTPTPMYWADLEVEKDHEEEPEQSGDEDRYGDEDHEPASSESEDENGSDASENEFGKQDDDGGGDDDHHHHHHHHHHQKEDVEEDAYGREGDDTMMTVD